MAHKQQDLGDANVLFDHVDVSTWVWKAPQEMRNRKGSSQLFVDKNATDRTAPRFQLCPQSMKMCAPFGFELEDGTTVQDIMSRPGGKLKLQLNTTGAELTAFIDGIDDALLAKAKEERDKWWPGKSTSDSKIEKDMKRILKVDEQGKYPDKIKIKIITNGKRQTRILRSINDTSFVDSDATCLTAGSHVIPIVECGGVWISGLGYGMDLIATELMVFPNKGKKRAFDMILDTPMHEASVDEVAADQAVGAEYTDNTADDEATLNDMI
jgi:hypothetical protein